MVWWWLVACKKKELPPPDHDPVSAPAGVDALVRALSVRDGEPSCARLAEGVGDDPVPAFVWVAEHVDLPAVAPMRAVRCLATEHGAAAEPALTGWLTDPGSEGYAREITAALAALPTDLAVRLATAGLAGPHAALVVESVRAAPSAELRSLAP